MQFHSAPVTELTSVPEFGMHGLIRSKIASIRTFGAHVFRLVAPERRPPSSRMPKRLARNKVRVRVQTFPHYPTIVSDAFFGRPAADSSVKRKELRAQLPSEREKRLSATELSKKVSESAASLRAEYRDFVVNRFLSIVNDPSVTWVRQVTAGRNEQMVMGGEPRPIDVYYLSDMSPRNKDGCTRSLNDPSCTAIAAPVPPRERFENPRTPNRHTMLGAASAYEGKSTNLLCAGTRGSHFSWHVEDSLL